MNEIKRALIKSKLTRISGKRIYNLDYLERVLNIDLSLLEQYNNWYLLKDELYYYKKITTQRELLIELIGVKLAEYFGSDTVKYILVKNRFSYGIISKNFKEGDKKYYDYLALGIRNYETSKNNRVILKESCKDNDNYKDLYKKLIKLMVQDFYSMQTDRHEDNFYFSKDLNKYLDLAPLFDYGNSFSFETETNFSNPLMRFDLNKKEDIEQIRLCDYTMETFYKAMDINLRKIIREICEEYKLIINADNYKEFFEIDNESKTKIKDYILR